MTPNSQPTGEALAALEVHVLHSYGKLQLCDIPDHLVRSTCDTDLARLRALLGLVWACEAAHQPITINYKCRGIRRPLDGSHVNLHPRVRNIERLHAGRWQRHEGT